jgi:hypothetical protein
MILPPPPPGTLVVLANRKAGFGYVDQLPCISVYSHGVLDGETVQFGVWRETLVEFGHFASFGILTAFDCEGVTFSEKYSCEKWTGTGTAVRQTRTFLKN